MSAVHSASISRTGRRWLARVALALFAATSLTTGCEAIAEEPVAAVFKARELGFIYRSSTTEYACDELENRVARILVAAGARDDIRVTVSNCDTAVIPDRGRPWDRQNSWDRSNPSDRFGSSVSSGGQSAHVRVRLMFPVEATPEVLAEMDKDKSRRDLISRVTGDPAAMFNDPIVFPAQRQQVTLSHRSMRLEPEDCELLEQMSSGVLRELGVRVVRRNFSCNPRQLSRIPPQLTVEALLPAGAVTPRPVPGGETEPSEPAAPASEPSEPANETPSR